MSKIDVGEAKRARFVPPLSAFPNGFSHMWLEIFGCVILNLVLPPIAAVHYHDSRTLISLVRVYIEDPSFPPGLT